MEKIKNLSLRKTLVLYLLVGLSVAIVLSIIVSSIADRAQQDIFSKYIDPGRQEVIIKYGGRSLDVPTYQLTEEDRVLKEWYDVVSSWSIIVFSFTAAGLSVFFFYRNKLKKPIGLLRESSEKIARDTLDFQIHYEHRDEMGQLCDSFEHMREQLFENNRKLWKAIDEQKLVRSAIAHDIRTPLAIIKGYGEMLLEFIPEEKLEKGKIIEILQSSQGQVHRLEDFVETMKQLSSIDERVLCNNMIDFEILITQIQEILSIYTKPSYPALEITVTNKKIHKFYGDTLLILEVTENLISNAVRFAEQQVKISISIENDFLHVNVTDNGIGFREDFGLALKAYYHNNAKEASEHYGLGLYISKQLCELHGGNINLNNLEKGGASATATFKIKALV